MTERSLRPHGGTLTTGALHILSIDHPDRDLAALGPAGEASANALARFRQLVVAAAGDAAGKSEADHVGIFLDPATASTMAADLDQHGLWLACQYPHRAAPDIVEAAVAALPANAVVKVIANARTDAKTVLALHHDEIRAVAAACRKASRELMVEALVDTGRPVAELISALGADGIAPRYWLLEPQATASAWADVIVASAGAAAGVPARLITIARALDSMEDFAVARSADGVAGFVGGRSVFGAPLAQWLAGGLDDSAAQRAVSDRFAQLRSCWNTSRVGDR